jgi:hypothetical protein
VLRVENFRWPDGIVEQLQSPASPGDIEQHPLALPLISKSHNLGTETRIWIERPTPGASTRAEFDLAFLPFLMK